MIAAYPRAARRPPPASRTPARGCSGSASSSAIRDELAGRLADVRAQAAAQGERQARQARC